MKTKILRGDHQPHLNKDLRKAIMKRSRLKKIANKSKNAVDIAYYKKQRNLVVNMNRQAKKSYFTDSLKSSKCFWKSVKPYFDSKANVSDERILLVESNKVLTDDNCIASVFNNYFNRITDNLNVPVLPGLPVQSTDPVSSAIAKFAFHPSILSIKGRNLSSFTKTPFDIHKISEETIIKEILALNPGKSVNGDISIKALQLAVHECSGVLTSIFNSQVIDSSVFPDELKLADIIPVHKKGCTTDKANYRPISLLPAISKVFERLIMKQIEPFINTWLSKYLCGFRRKYSCQYSLLNMIRKWQSTLNASGIVGAILMDLSKAFDCLPHDLLIAKLHAYGFGKRSLDTFYSYLSNRFHRVRIGSSFSEFLELLLGVPQGSVLGPIFFNIFINDLLFLVQEDICNFADDNTLYVCSHDISDIQYRIKLNLVLEWFTLKTVWLPILINFRQYFSVSIIVSILG